MPTTRPQKNAPKFSGSSFDEMVSALSAGFGSFEARRLGSSRPLNWQVDFWSDGNLTLVTNKDDGGWTGRTASDTRENFNLVFTSSGSLSFSRARSQVGGTPGTMLLINNHEFDWVTVPDGSHRSESISIDWTIMARTFNSVFERPLVGGLDMVQGLDLNSQPGQYIAMLAQTISAGMRDDGPLLRSPIALSNMTEALAELVIRNAPHRFSYLLEGKVHLIAPRHVRQAIGYMHENISRPLLIQDVAQAVGVSVRALEMGFRSFKGISPSTYLRMIRLNAVRDELLNPYCELGLAEICLKWGFFHQGRFAAFYRAAFGENPSDTRRRSTH